MQTKTSDFVKLWGMPISLGLLTILGLILAILGTGVWHLLSWIGLGIPIYISVKFGRKFFGLGN